MSENTLLRNAFIDFLQQMLPLVIDPMMIVRRHFENLIKILGDPTQPNEKIVGFVEKLKIKPEPKKNKKDNSTLAELNTQPSETQTIKKTAHQLASEPSIKARQHRRCISNQQDLTYTERNLIQEEKFNVVVEKPEPFKLESPQTLQHFHKFLQIQQTSGFSVIQKEYILDNIESGMKEFQRNTKTLLCLAERSSEVNTSESNDCDKSLKKTDYTFTTYTTKVLENQKLMTRQKFYAKDFKNTQTRLRFMK